MRAFRQMFFRKAARCESASACRRWDHSCSSKYLWKSESHNSRSAFHDLSDHLHFYNPMKSVRVDQLTSSPWLRPGFRHSWQYRGVCLGPSRTCCIHRGGDPSANNDYAIVLGLNYAATSEALSSRSASPHRLSQHYL